jgi:hypothetical protein
VKDHSNNRIDWLRWTLPPGVSIVVHAVLIGLVAFIGMQISAHDEPERSYPITELELPDQPEQSELPQSKTPPEQKNQSARDQRQNQSVSRSDQIDQAAAQLRSFDMTTPTMDPVALAALQASNAQIANPQSAAPPSVRFAGVQTRAARKIVYVVDGSGATANSFAYLQTQLLRSIDRLSPTQRFQVVLFRSFNDHTVSYAPLDSSKLSRATLNNKARVSDWLNDISSRGRSNPIEGLRAALALKPDLVLLITRSIQRTEMGWAQGQREILSELNILNPLNPETGKRPTVIKTIQLLDEDPTGIMRAIGTFHGDNINNQSENTTEDYRVVTYEDLIKPDDEEIIAVSSIGASNEQRISAANDLMGPLTQSGTSFSVFYSYADETQRERALLIASRIRALVNPLTQVDGRAAILDAQAALIFRTLNPQSISDKQLNSIIASLSDVMYSDPNTDAQRVLTVAQTHLLLGDIDQAQTLVRELFNLADELGLDRTTYAQIALALVAIGGMNEQMGAAFNTELENVFARPPFVTRTGAIDAVWGLLAREAMTKAQLKSAKSQIDPWLPLIEIREAARSNESIRNYIDARINLILENQPADVSLRDLPSQVLLAAANTRSHEHSTRIQALDLLDEVARREEIPQQQADALWKIGVLGRSINTVDSRLQSSSALLRLAKQHPEHERAYDAISGAIHDGSDSRMKININDQRDRLDYAVSRFADHPEIDLWRLELAEMLTDFARLDVLDPVSPLTREGVLAGELYEQTVLGMLDRFDDPQTRLALAMRMRDAAVRFEMPGASMWTKRAAINEIEMNPESAITSIDQLIRDTRLANESTQELELMRAQTLNRLGQSRAAFDALSELSQRIDATGNHTSTYWQAWSLMLETIIKNGSPNDRSDALRHIARLQLIDSNLGGSPWNQRIIEAQQTLHSSP